MGHTLTFNTGASPHIHVPVYVFMHTLAIYRWILSLTHTRTQTELMQVHLCVFVFVYTCVQWLCPGRPHSLSMGSSFHDLETIFTTGSHAARVGAGSKARHTITPRAPCSRVDMKIRYLRHVSARAPQAGPPVTTFSERGARAGTVPFRPIARARVRACAYPHVTCLLPDRAPMRCARAQ